MTDRRHPAPQRCKALVHELASIVQNQQMPVFQQPC